MHCLFLAMHCLFVAMHCPFLVMHCPFLAMHCLFVAMHCPFLVMHCPFLAMHCLFVAMHCPLLGMPHPFLAMLHAFVAMLCPFLGMPRPFLAMPRAFLAMHCPLLAMRRASVGHRHPQRATLPPFAEHRDELAAIPKKLREMLRCLRALSTLHSPESRTGHFQGLPCLEHDLWLQTDRKGSPKEAREREARVIRVQDGVHRERLVFIRLATLDGSARAAFPIVPPETHG
jgi:hypothetical protein